MKFIVPVESIKHNSGGVILYDPIANVIEKQYVHNKKWKYDRTGWRGGVLHGDYLIATDWTDLHYFNVKTWKHEKTVTKSTWNDLHYLYIHEGKLYIANTGIDAIEVADDIMNPVKTDLRFIFDDCPHFTKKPIDVNHKWNEEYKTGGHVCHPNCIFVKKGRAIVTCFENETRGFSSGKIVDINSGRILLDRHNCHDGNLYKGDYYLSLTRKDQVLIIKNVFDRKWPVRRVDRVINIGGKGWWRGMIIHEGKIYVFASYAYNVDRGARMAIIDIKTGESKLQNLPVFDGKVWDTIYQPCLLET